MEIGYTDNDFDPQLAFRQAIQRQVDIEDSKWYGEREQPKFAHFTLKKERWSFSFKPAWYKKLIPIKL